MEVLLQFDCNNMSTLKRLSSVSLFPPTLLTVSFPSPPLTERIKKTPTSLLPVIVQVTPLDLEEWKWLKMTRRHVECYSSKSSTSLRIRTSQSTGRTGAGSDSAPLRPPSRPRNADQPPHSPPTPHTPRLVQVITPHPPPPNPSHTNTHTQARTHAQRG